MTMTLPRGDTWLGVLDAIDMAIKGAERFRTPAGWYHVDIIDHYLSFGVYQAGPFWLTVDNEGKPSWWERRYVWEGPASPDGEQVRTTQIHFIGDHHAMEKRAGKAATYHQILEDGKRAIAELDEWNELCDGMK